MARILIISSLVADGSVGGGLSQFVLQRLGHRVALLPTILLSNSPDQPDKAGQTIAVELLDRMTGAYEAAKQLSFDAALIGYLPSSEHVAFALRLVGKLRTLNPDLLLCVDPVMGDDPGGLYVKEETACAIRDDLAPRADILTPNLFELTWLAKRSLPHQDEIDRAAAQLQARIVLVTSAAKNAGTIASRLIDKDSGSSVETLRFAQAPHGAGDMVCAAFLGHALNGVSNCEAFAKAIAGVCKTIEASQSLQRLQYIATQSVWAE